MTALVVLAASRFVPLGAVQFYVQAAAGLIGLWPLAYRMWTPEVSDAGARYASQCRQRTRIRPEAVASAGR